MQDTYLSLFFHPSIHTSCLSVGPSLSVLPSFSWLLFVSLWLVVSQSIRPSIDLVLCLSFSLSIFFSVYLYLCQSFFCLFFICLPVCLFDCLSVSLYLSLSLPVVIHSQHLSKEQKWWKGFFTLDRCHASIPTQRQTIFNFFFNFNNIHQQWLSHFFCLLHLSKTKFQH